MIHSRICHKPLYHTKFIAICLSFCLALGMAACQAVSTGTPTLGTPTPQGTILSFKTVEQEDSSGTGIMYESKNPGIIIVSSIEDIKNLTGLVSENSIKQFQTINYQSYFIVATFQGRKPETGYGIQVDQILRAEDTVNIFVTLHEPKPPEHPGEIVSSPFHVVKVQKIGNWGREITFNMMTDSQLVTSTAHTIP